MSSQIILLYEYYEYQRLLKLCQTYERTSTPLVSRSVPRFVKRLPTEHDSVGIIYLYILVRHLFYRTRKYRTREYVRLTCVLIRGALRSYVIFDFRSCLHNSRTYETTCTGRGIIYFLRVVHLYVRIRRFTNTYNIYIYIYSIWYIR